MKNLPFIAIAFISFTGFAQTVTYIKSNGRKTASKDSALLIRTITETKQGSGIYSFTENFVTGEPFRIGKTLKANDILPDGACTAYYPSGKKLFTIVFKNGLEQTDTIFFANGVIFKVSQFTRNTPDLARPTVQFTQESIITCNDSTGKALITHGKGYFVGYRPVIDRRFTAIVTNPVYSDWLYNDFEEGEMGNGIKDGAWKGKIGGVQYTEVYKKGKFINGESIDNDGTHYKYESSIEKPGSFPKGMQAFYNYIASALQYPAGANTGHFEGKVSVAFVVQKDGSLSDIRMLQPLSDDLSNEIMRVIKASPPWNPGSQRGVPIKQPFIIPVSYNLSAKK